MSNPVSCQNRALITSDVTRCRPGKHRPPASGPPAPGHRHPGHRHPARAPGTRHRGSRAEDDRRPAVEWIGAGQVSASRAGAPVPINLAIYLAINNRLLSAFYLRVRMSIHPSIHPSPSGQSIRERGRIDDLLALAESNGRN